VRRVFRATYYLAGTVFFLSIAIMGFTQTKTFRTYLHTRVSSYVAQELHGELKLGEIKGNLITGFHVEDVALSESGQLLFAADKIEATYEPLGMLFDRMTFSSIKLTNPTIRIVRASDGVWNVNRLFPPASQDTTQSQAVVTLKSIQLVNAHVTIVDSLKMSAVDSLRTLSQALAITQYPTLALQAFQLDAFVRIAPEGVEATVHQLKFISDQPAFELSRLSGEFALSKSEINVKKLEVETGESRLTAAVAVRQVDLTALESIDGLKGKPVSVSLSSEKLSLAELRRLFPGALSVLDKEIAAQVKLGGTVDKLQIENLLVRTPRSFIKMEGTLTNLHRPDDLTMDLVCLNNTLDPSDLPIYLPNVSVPDMSSMGELTFNLRFTGTPSVFMVRFEGESAAGKLTVEGSSETRNDTLAYHATVTTERFNLAAVVGDDALRTNLHSSITLKGAGTNLQTMTMTLRAQIDSSEFYGMPLSASTVAVDIANQSVRAQVQLHSGNTEIALTGSARTRNETISNYLIDGTISSLNIAPLLKSERYTSALSFTLHVEGKGLTFGDMQTNLNLAFGPSSFGSHEFVEGQAHAELDARNPDHQTFHLTSSIADMNIEGKFHLDSFIATLEHSGTLIAEAISHRVNSLDSLGGGSPSTKREQHFQSSIQHLPRSVEAIYDVKVNDLFPLGVFLGYHLAGSGTVTGSLEGSLDDLHMSGSAILDAFAYADSTVALEMYDAGLSYRVEGISRTAILDSVQAQMEFTANRLDFNNVKLYAPAVQLDLHGVDGTYALRALADSSVNIELSGTSLYKDGLITYTLDKLNVAAQSYTVANNDPIVVTLGRNGVRFDQFWMRHEVEEIKIVGLVEPRGSSDLEVEVVNFLLSNVQLFSRNPAFVRDVREFGGIIHARGRVRGSFDNPQFSLNLVAHGVRYGQTVFGQIETRALYLDRRLELFSEFRSKPEQAAVPPDFFVSGYLPYDFALTQRSATPLEGEMDLAVRSRGLRLELLDPFIAELSSLTGTMVCDMKIRGTLRKPSYEGSVSLQSARFFFNPLGITYVLDGHLKPAGQRIALENFTMSNIPQDRQDGVMNFSGSFTLDGITLKDFDLRTHGQLLVMKESARQAGQAVFGNLFAAVGPNGLHWQGTPQRSVVSGKIFVKNANLTLPPNRELLLQTNRDVTITVVDDTSRVLRDTVASFNQRNGLNNSVNGNGSALLALNNGAAAIPLNGRSVRSPEEQDDSRSFLDRLVYDLDIETQGPTYLRFIFNPYTGEELFADLKGRMAFTKGGDQTRLTGEVEVGDRSYYNFLKRFQATGKLTFTGDALNPELNILARYESAYQSPDTTQAAGGSSGRLSSSFAGEFHPTRVIVLLQISGTRKEPKPKFGIELVGKNGEHQDFPSGDVESEAITFIITGSFRDDLTQQERSSLLGSNLLYGLTSSVLSGPITDFIRKEFGFVSSVDVVYYGGDVQSSTDVRVTGEVGEAVIRFGGRVFSDIGNANASVQLPMSSVLGSEKWRNLIIEVERRVEGMESYEQRRELNGVRLIYRITF